VRLTLAATGARLGAMLKPDLDQHGSDFLFLCFFFFPLCFSLFFFFTLSPSKQRIWNGSVPADSVLEGRCMRCMGEPVYIGEIGIRAPANPGQQRGNSRSRDMGQRAKTSS